MKVTKEKDGVQIHVDERELKLLRRALERASYIDTPPGEQEAILAFCARAIDLLGQA
jgi:hypothetical protein